MNIDSSIPAVFWTYGKLKVDPSGNTTGSYIAPTGATTTITGGVFTVDSDGVGAGGMFSMDTGDTLIMNHLKMDPGKTNSDGVWTTTSGMMSIGLFIKESNVALPGTPLLLLDD